MYKLILIIVSTLSFGWTQSLFPLNSIPITVRDLAFSGGGGAIKSSQISINPASIDIAHKSATFNTQFLPAGISLLSFHVIYPKNKFIFSASVSNLNFGLLKDGITNDKFSANDLMIKTGIKGNLFNMFSVGGSLSYNFGIIEKSIAQSFSFSGGILSQTNDGYLGLGVTVKNLNYQIDYYGESKEDFSYQILSSFFLRPKHLSAILFSDIIIEKNIINNILISGVELYPNNNLILRLSNGIMLINSPKINRISFGIQFNINKWTVGLATQNLISAGFINGLTFQKYFD